MVQGWLRDCSRMEQPRAEFVKGLAAGFRSWLLGSGAGCWVRSYKPLSPSYCEDRRSTARGSQEQPGAARSRIRQNSSQNSSNPAARSSQEQPGAEFVRIRHRIRQLRDGSGDCSGDGSMMAQRWFRDGSGMAQGWSSQEQNSSQNSSPEFVTESVKPRLTTESVKPSSQDQPGAARSSQGQPGAAKSRIRQNSSQNSSAQGWLRGLLWGWLNDGSMMAQGWFRDGSGMAQGWSSQEQNSLREPLLP